MGDPKNNKSNDQSVDRATVGDFTKRGRDVSPNTPASPQASDKPYQPSADSGSGASGSSSDANSGGSDS